MVRLQLFSHLRHAKRILGVWRSTSVAHASWADAPPPAPPLCPLRPRHPRRHCHHRRHRELAHDPALPVFAES
eukprot:2653040-Prymnesium_polylepis.1